MAADEAAAENAAQRERGWMQIADVGIRLRVPGDWFAWFDWCSVV